VDNMDYEELLERFGSGHEPQKASVTNVSALPVSKLSEADLPR
jgi:hypothetical protein